jgi:hypothetical protein
MTFWILQQRLLENLRERVRNGELTERRLGRLTGTSQPHIHNVLKGVRAFSTELADQIIQVMHIDLAELMSEQSPSENGLHCSIPLLSGHLGTNGGNLRFDRISNAATFPSQSVGNLSNPVAVILGPDSEMAPRFHAGDMVVLEQIPAARLEICKDAVYAVQTDDGIYLRYIRRGGCILYLPSEQSIQCPSKWQLMSLAGRDLLDIVRGRVVWISRQLETRGHAA